MPSSSEGGGCFVSVIRMRRSFCRKRWLGKANRELNSAEAVITEDDGDAFQPKPSYQYEIKTTSLLRKPSEEPKINFENKSKYEVSFYVLQEDKVEIHAVREGNQNELGASVAIAGDGIGSLGAKALRKVDITKDLRRANRYFLAEDLRFGPEGTSVPFPRDCKDLRVFGYFRRDSSRGWTCFKNKVYSIDRGDKIFTLTATDGRIEKYLLDDEVSGYDSGRVPPAGVGPGSPSRDAANWPPPFQPID